MSKQEAIEKIFDILIKNLISTGESADIAHEIYKKVVEPCIEDERTAWVALVYNKFDG